MVSKMGNMMRFKAWPGWPILVFAFALLLCGVFSAVDSRVFAMETGGTKSSPSGAEKASDPLPAAGAQDGKDSIIKKELGLSVEGKPIMAYYYNKSEKRPTLVFSGIHGDERTSVELGQMLLKRWNEDPGILGGKYVIYIPMANPDGCANNTRRNANKVDCNRNFPDEWENTKSGGSTYGGPRPLSEPEARILYQLVNEEKPVKIVSIHSCSKCGGKNNYDGPAEALAKAMSKKNGYEPLADWYAKTPGSFGTFAGKGKGIPTITLELPRNIETEKEWEGNILAVEAAVQFEIEEKTGDQAK